MRPLCSLYAGGVLWARNCAQKGSVKSVRSVREKPSTKYASSLIGVTSHTTPLPTGEGPGEGPAGFAGEASRFAGEATVHSVRDNVF